MDANRLEAIALVLGAICVLLLAGVAVLRAVLVQRSEKTLLKALGQRAVAAKAAGADESREPEAGRQPFGQLSERAAQIGMRWLDTGFGRQFVAEEDRQLLEQSGFVEARSRGLFLSARIACSIVLPLIVAVVLTGHTSGSRWLLGIFAAMALGFMLPKIYIRRRGAARRQSVANELPLLVDMLRLLQGVGLSLDQSIQVVMQDFTTMLPVLSWELGVAQRQFAAGRTREQSLQRLTNSFDNEDLRAIVRLLIQVDKHGGAVQEPLQQFGDRLREGRRASLRERIGRLTVKMTGVMIVTLLPALLIVTAGPGIMTVVSALAAVKH